MQASDTTVDYLCATDPDPLKTGNSARVSSQSVSTYEDFICIPNGNVDISEVAVRLTGNYEVDVNNGVITKVNSYSPSVSVTGYGLNPGGATISVSISNVIRSRSFTAQSATFTATFDVFCTAGAYDAKIFAGNFTISITGDTNGGEATSFTPNDGSGNRYVYPN